MERGTGHGDHSPAGERASGRWRAQARKADGTSLSQSFKTKTEAKNWARWAEEELARNRRVDAGKLRFGDLIDAYTDAHKSMGRSKSAGIALIRRRLGAKPLLDMSRGQTYVDFVERRERDGAGPATEKRGHLRDFLNAYNFAKRLKTLRGLTVFEFISKQWIAEPERFHYHPDHLTAGLNS